MDVSSETSQELTPIIADCKLEIADQKSSIWQSSMNLQSAIRNLQ
jgi:hypothetical protein